VADDQLAAAFEELEEGGGAPGALEDVLLVDPHHGQAAPVSAQGVALPGERLLLDQQVLASNQPLVA
jgi:hypothetical protein